MPDAFLTDVFFVLIDIGIDDVVAVCPAQFLFERQVQNLVVHAQKPGIGLVSGKSGAVDPGLLAGTDTDGLAVIGVGNGIGLGVFEGDQGNDEVTFGFWWKFLVGSDDIL